MGSLLGKIVREHHGESTFRKVEELRSLAKEWRSDPIENAESFRSMATFASGLTDEELFRVGRAFTHFLAICNTAEAHHRVRRVKEELRAAAMRDDDDVDVDGDDGSKSCRALRDSRDSCGRVFADLIESGRATPEVLRESIANQTVEFVLTAHPTEVNRRTLLYKKTRIQKLLAKADEYRAIGGATPYQRRLINDKLEREVTGLWQSDELSRKKPTVQDEASKGTLVIDTVLWDALPSFLRKLDATMKSDLGEGYGLPLDASPIRFASWMGGDRDGNPNVTPRVTREVCASNRLKAARLYRRDLVELLRRLSLTNCSEELREAIEAKGNAREESRQPYRVFLNTLAERMAATERWAASGLEALESGEEAAVPPPPSDAYLSKEEFLDDILLVHRSLSETNNAVLADGKVIDLVRNVSAFGLTLCPLDVRQESDRHTEALDCVTRYLGLGSYGQWDEETRMSWLQRQLTSKRPLMRSGEWYNHPDVFTDTAIDTLETFRMIADQYEDSLGAYVISQATNASDVLAVLLLQKDAGVKKPLRVTPLFETLDDLEGAPENVDRLLAVPAYRGSINGKQEIMIGYSDSAKDAGRLAASWAQYKSQEALVEIGSKHGIDVTFFHGKGGTVGRGGNPATFEAILAHAPNTIDGEFRVTEQGEMIEKNFGLLDRAERTMDIYTAAVLAEKHTPRPSPTDGWRRIMEELSDVSCAAYRKVVREEPRFVPYFRQATPELELGSMNIGSRPAKRKATGGVESLRAIPWIFAWMQTRLNLPVWLGVGEALRSMLNDEKKADQLRGMYEEWGSFQTTIDMVEMVLAKSEPDIAEHYDETLVRDGGAKELGKELRRAYRNTEDAVLDLTGHDVPAEHNRVLRRALEVRNPYVDVLNVMQAETLKRVRAREEEGGEESEVLRDSLRTTITGVANGMGNTG